MSSELRKPKVGRTIQHLEDLILVDGSQGALLALHSLEEIAYTTNDVMVKFDGCPAVYFGRDEDGDFILTDKSGFTAKGYNGKAKSAEVLYQIIISRGSGSVNDSRITFAKNMHKLWTELESITSLSLRGFFLCDVLYFNKPHIKDDEFEFTPNVVTYNIPTESHYGISISNSNVGIVIHSYQDLSGIDMPVSKYLKELKGGSVFIIKPTPVLSVPKVNINQINDIRRYVTDNASLIDKLLNDKMLSDNKLSDFKQTLYKYINHQVKTRSMTDLNINFDNWVIDCKISENKRKKIIELREMYASEFSVIFSIIEDLIKVKNKIINSLDEINPIKSRIGNQYGGEGYIKGNIKLVSREKFTVINKEKHS